MAEQTWKWGWFQSAGLAAPGPASPSSEPVHPLRPVPVAPGPHKKPRRRWLVLVLLLLLAVSVGVWNARRRQQTGGSGTGAAAGRTAKVFAGPFEQTLRIAGTVSARNFAAIVAPQMRGGERGPGGGGGGLGQLILVKLAPAGSHVKKGDVIAQFDGQWEVDHLEGVRNDVAQRQASVDKRRAEMTIETDTLAQQVRTARADWEKAKLDMQTAEVRSAIDAEKFKLAVEETAARFKQIQEDVRLKKESQAAELKGLEIQVQQDKMHQGRHERNVERMVMRAPIDGLVVMQSIFRSGQFGQVQEGDQVFPGTYFMQIVDLTQMVVNGYVNQVDSHAMALGQKAAIRLEAYPDLVLPGKLTSVGAMAGGGSRGYRGSARDLWVKQVPVRFAIEAPDKRVIPDLSASADVVVHRESRALQAPREAVSEQSGKTYVSVKQGEKFERREVELGRKNGTHYVIVAGLAEGDEVALEP